MAAGRYQATAYAVRDRGQEMEGDVVWDVVEGGCEYGKRGN